jgi:hypothetical protein
MLEFQTGKWHLLSAWSGRANSATGVDPAHRGVSEAPRRGGRPLGCALTESVGLGFKGSVVNAPRDQIAIGQKLQDQAKGRLSRRLLSLTTVLFLRTFWSFGFEYSTRRAHGALRPPHRAPLARRRLALRSPAGEWVRSPVREPWIRQRQLPSPAWTTEGLSSMPSPKAPGSGRAVASTPHTKPPCSPGAARLGPACSRPRAVLAPP